MLQIYICIPTYQNLKKFEAELRYFLLSAETVGKSIFSTQVLLLTSFDTRWHKVKRELKTSFTLIFEKGHPIRLMWRPSCKSCSLREIPVGNRLLSSLRSLLFPSDNNELFTLPLQPPLSYTEIKL